MNNIIQNLKHYLINLPGWRTNRKIVVIESDDWGSIRMPSKETFNRLKGMGHSVEKDVYSRFDSLETEEDLTRIFELLIKYKDINGRNPIITANSVVANPDFLKIKENNFQEYYYELVTDTYKSYEGCENSFKLIEQGITENLFFPQFHGREHLNVNLWMKALQNKTKSALDTFDLNLFAINSNDTLGNRNNYMAAFDFYDTDNEHQVLSIISDGMRLFEQLYGYKSKSFIAPCYTWSSSIEKRLHELGVVILQGIIKQKIPVNYSEKKYKSAYHYMGQQNKLGQKYLIRNSFMEASHTKKLGSDFCLNAIDNAFALNKPAIIGAHRVNFLGKLDEKNQKENFIEFDKIFSSLLKKWPNVEFMSSSELGDIMLTK